MAATVTGNYLKPQLLYKGTTKRCHSTVEFPSGWDIWHSANHWSNEETMKRFAEKILIPFICDQRMCLHLESTHTALVVFDGFRGRNTPEFIKFFSHLMRIESGFNAHCRECELNAHSMRIERFHTAKTQSTY